jgi:hypothetical protein
MLSYTRRAAMTVVALLILIAGVLGVGAARDAHQGP